MVSYFTPEELARIKAQALEDARRSSSEYQFIHGVLFRLVERQEGAKYWSHKMGDGVFKMKYFDLNPAAEFVEISLAAWSEWKRDKASNDKSW